MRLATVSHAGATRAVAQETDGWAPITKPDGTVYADIGELLRAGIDAGDAAREALASGEAEAVDPARILRPVLACGAVVCVGLNYKSHILEMGRELPEHPTLFSKLDRALTDPYADIALPACSDQIDYEGELAVVIGPGGRDIEAGDAWNAIAGVTIMNDVTARDYQRRTIQWFAGKSFEASTPVGPFMVTPDEFNGIAAPELIVEVNGEERQRAPISDLLFDVPTLVADISRMFTLRPGDIIATGTPAGVGFGMEPRHFLADSDVVEVRIDGLGSLRNTFKASGS